MDFINMDGIADDDFSNDDSSETSKDVGQSGFKVELNESFVSEDDNVLLANNLSLANISSKPNTLQFNIDNYQIEPPLPIILNKLYNCQFAFSINANCFYIHIEENYKSLQNLRDAINEYGTIAKPLNIVEVDKIYLVRYSLDDEWYRAKIISAEEPRNYKVSYIDYGNEETVDVNRIRECPTALRILPSYAQQCSLFNLMPSKDDWSKDSNEMLERFLQFDLNIMAFSHDADGTFKVEIRAGLCTDQVSGDNSFSIQKVMIFLGLAKYEDPTIGHQVPPPAQNGYLQMDVDVNSYNSVRIKYIVSPKYFYISLKSAEEEHENKMSQLQEYCIQYDVYKNLEWRIFLPEEEMPCLVYEKEDGRFYRALVTQVKRNGNIEIYYVDTGKWKDVTYIDIRKMPFVYLKMPMQAIHCSINGIQLSEDVSNWGEKVLRLFNYMTSRGYEAKAQFLTRVGNDSYDINLYFLSPTGRQDFGQLLVKRNLAIKEPGEGPDDEEENGHYFESSVQKKEAYKVAIVRSAAKSNDDPQKRIAITLLKVVSPYIIFIRVSTWNDTVRSLQDQLSKEPKIFETNISIGTTVMVPFEKNSYTRARVVEVHEETVKVVHLDIGGFRIYPKTLLFKLQKDRKNGNKYSFLVKLSHIIPPCGQETWPSSSIETLNQILSNAKKTLFMLKTGDAEKDPNCFNMKVLPVKIGWSEILTSGPFSPDERVYPIINDYMVSQGFALYDRSLKTSTPQKKETNIESDSLSDDLCLKPPKVKPMETVRKVKKGWPPAKPLKESFFHGIATYVDHSGYIFIQPIKNIPIIHQITSSYDFMYDERSHSKQDYVFEEGDAVAARWGESSSWYRAEIIKEIRSFGGDLRLKVKFSDYGNEDECRYEDIRVDPRHQDKSLLCYKCELIGVKPRHGEYTTKQLDYMHQSIVDEKCAVSLEEPHDPNSPLKVSLTWCLSGEDVADWMVEVNQFEHTGQPRKKKGKPGRENTSQSSVSASTNEEILELLESDTEDNVSYADTPSYEDFYLDLLPRLNFPVGDGEPFPIKLINLLDTSRIFIRPVVNDNLDNDVFRREVETVTAQYEIMCHKITHEVDSYDILVNPDLDDIHLAINSKGQCGRMCLLEKATGKYVNVRFIDFGNDEVLNITRIKKMPKFCYNYKPITIQATLSSEESFILKDVMPAKLYEVSRRLLKREDLYAAVLVSGHLPKVKLFYIENGERKLLFKSLRKSNLI